MNSVLRRPAVHRAAGHRTFAALLVGAAALFAPLAHAGLFDDDEARKAILDMRAKIEANTAAQRSSQADLLDQINQLKRSMLDLSNQLELVRGDNAKLRGQNEQLARDISDVQRTQKDIQSGVDTRLRQFEPQKVSVDGKEFTADPEEKRQYDEAMALLRNSDFNGSSNALGNFRKRWPSSGYTDSVLFWLGSSQYATRQYKDSITSFRSLVSASPDNPRAPEALLAIANCQAELKDVKGARKTLDELLKTYPQAEAAQAGRDRLAALK